MTRRTVRLGTCVLLAAWCMGGCGRAETRHVELVLEVELPDSAITDVDRLVNATAAVIAARLTGAGIRHASVRSLGPTRIGVAFESPEAAAERLTAFAITPGRLEIRVTDKAGRFRDALPALDRALVHAGVTTAHLLEHGGVGIEALLAPLETAAADSAGTAQDARPLSALLLPGQVPGGYVVLEQHVGPVDSLLRHPTVAAGMPPQVELLWGSDTRSQAGRSFRPLYAVERRALITGEHVADAAATSDPATGGSLVRFHLTPAGGAIFARETARHIGDHLAIVLDRWVRGGPPLLRDAIHGNGQIDMGNTELRDAEDLALLLRTGPLPARVRLIEEGASERPERR